MNPHRTYTPLEASVIRVTEKRMERLDTIAAVTDRMYQLGESDRAIWLWVCNEAHAAAEDLRGLHRTVENADQGGADDEATKRANASEVM